VLSVLLFFLLSVATMEKLGAHDVNLPQQTQDFTKESPLEVKNLGVSLSRTGLVLRGLVVAGGREPEALHAEWPIVEGRYDLPRLRDELLRIKAGYKTDAAIILMIADDVSFDAVVQVMDTVREQIVVEGGRRHVTTLFPEISISDYLLDRTESEA
jgi:biopolymer transport protein ExbD